MTDFLRPPGHDFFSQFHRHPLPQHPHHGTFSVLSWPLMLSFRRQIGLVSLSASSPPPPPPPSARDTDPPRYLTVSRRKPMSDGRRRPLSGDDSAGPDDADAIAHPSVVGPVGFDFFIDPPPAVDCCCCLPVPLAVTTGAVLQDSAAGAPPPPVDVFVSCDGNL